MGRRLTGTVAIRLVGLLVGLVATSVPAHAQVEAGSRAVTVAPGDATQAAANVGVFVGVNEFGPGANPLQYCVNDAVALAHLFCVQLKVVPPEHCYLQLAGQPVGEPHEGRLEELRRAGVKVGEASKFAVLGALGRAASLADDASGLLLVSFSTHGESYRLPERDEAGQPKLRKDGTPIEADVAHLLAKDSIDGDRESLIAMTEVAARLIPAKANKRLFLIDACRVTKDGRTPVRPGRAATSAPADPGMYQALKTSAGTAVLLSCSVAQKSYEDPALRQGLFTATLLAALTGSVEPDADHRISLAQVYAHTKAETQKLARRLVHQDQTPVLGAGTEIEALDIPLARVILVPKDGRDRDVITSQPGTPEIGAAGITETMLDEIEDRATRTNYHYDVISPPGADVAKHHFTIVTYHQDSTGIRSDERSYVVCAEHLVSTADGLRLRSRPKSFQRTYDTIKRRVANDGYKYVALETGISTEHDNKRMFLIRTFLLDTQTNTRTNERDDRLTEEFVVNTADGWRLK